MTRRIALAGLLALVAYPAVGRAQDPIGVQSFDCKAIPWMGVRLARLTSERLEQMATPVRRPEFIPARFPSDPAAVRASQLSALVRASVDAQGPDVPATKLEVSVEYILQNGKTHREKKAGTAATLEELADQIARQARRMTMPQMPETDLSTTSRPYLFHRLMGLAELELNDHDASKAAIDYERALALYKPPVESEALMSTWHARAIARGHKTRRSLADSALERWRVSKKRNNTDAIIEAALSFLRYTDRITQPWQVQLPLEAHDVSQLVETENQWLLTSNRGAGRELVTLDFSTGRIVHSESEVKGLRAVVGGQRVIAKGRTLTRLNKAGRTKWKLVLPSEPSRLELMGGVAPLVGATAVHWIDLSLGKLVAKASGIEPHAIGPEGVAVSSKGKLALLRPGREHPAWSVAVEPGPLSVELSADRIAVTSASGLFILDSRNGRTRAGPFKLGNKSRWLGIDGRYGVLAEEGSRAIIFDVLSGEKTASLTLPSPGVGSASFGDGVLIACRSGDVVQLDRDGLLLDRGRVMGEPLAVRKAHGATPLAVVISTQGVFSFSGHSKDADLDAFLDLSEALLASKETDLALSLASRLAREGTGRVARAEALRARALEAAGKKSAAELAQQRAQMAADLSKALPPYQTR